MGKARVRSSLLRQVMLKFVLAVFNGLQARVLRVYVHALCHADKMPLGIKLLARVREGHAVGNVIGKRMPRVGSQFAIQLDGGA